MRGSLGLVLSTLLIAAQFATPVLAQAPPTAISWLDRPLVQWNTPGMPVPTAQSPSAVNAPYCSNGNRPPDTSVDQTLVDHGWFLTTAYQGGWGLTIVEAQGGWDGMCRPLDYQGFVFSNGEYAGTIAPDLMAARADGSADFIYLRQGTLSVGFVRYADTDPLCCPSGGESNVIYHVDHTDAGPVLVADSVQRVSSP